MLRKRNTDTREPQVGRYLQMLDEASVGNSGSAVIAYNLLYLQPSGNFLFRGIWPGFELTEVAGQWSGSDGQIALMGRGETILDVDADYSNEAFERRLLVHESQGQRSLRATETLESWSLLSYPGEFRYIGLENTGVPKCLGFPESKEAIESRIVRLLLPPAPKPKVAPDIFIPGFLRRQKPT